MPSVSKLALIDVRQAARIAMKNVIVHATTISINVQFAILNARSRNMRR